MNIQRFSLGQTFNRYFHKFTPDMVEDDKGEYVKHQLYLNLEEDLKGLISTLEHHKEILKGAIEKTLIDNGHLADGDDCTLIDLKRGFEKVYPPRKIENE
jgi:hypothetical protein